MILNDEQLADLQHEINYAVKYQETYDELYDHILSEIETYPEQQLYTTSVAKQIIDDEFGGYEALKQMEEDRVKLINVAMRKKHWQNIKEFFNFPMAALTIAVTVAAYYIAATPHGRRVLVVFSSVSALTPILFIFYKHMLRKIYGWRTDVYQKQSLKQNYIFTAAILANSLLNVMNAFAKSIQLSEALTMAVFMFYVIYVLSFFKLYRQEFKMQLI